MKQQGVVKTLKKMACVPGLLMAAGGLFTMAAGTASAAYDVIGANTTITNDSANGIELANSANYGGNNAPNITVTIDGIVSIGDGTDGIAFSTIEDTDNGGVGQAYGSGTVNVVTGITTIRGSVVNNGDNRGASLITQGNVRLEIEGDLASSGKVVNVSVANDATLLINRELGEFAKMGDITGGTLGVGGDIAVTVENSFTINGGTLLVSGTTTGMDKVTVSSAGGDARISSYNPTDNLSFSEDNRPGMVVGAYDFVIETINGNITFSDYAFGGDNDLTFSGSGALTVEATGAGKNLNFNAGVILDTVTNNNEVTLSSAGGSVIVGSGQAFTYTGGTSPLTVSANQNVSFGGATTITQNNNGNTTLAAGTGGVSGNFTATGAFAYTSTSTDIDPDTGNLSISAQGNVSFDDTTTIRQAGDDATTITATNGTITHTGAYSYTAVDGDLTISANQNVSFDGTTTITQNNNGNTTITANQNVFFGGTTTISQADDGATTITAENGSITHAGAYSYTGVDGDLTISANQNVFFGGTTTISQADDGATTITATNGTITHTGAYRYTGVNGGLTETAATDLTFGANATIEFTGTGNTTLAAGTGGVSGNFTATGAFDYTSTSTGTDPDTGNLSISADQNVFFDGATTITQAGDDATTITANNGTITHRGIYNYTAVNGNLTERAATDLTFGADATINFTGTGSTALTAINGDITAEGAFDYTSTGGNLDITAQTLGKTITFEQDTDITMTGSGATTITAADGNITFGTDANNHFNYTGQNGNLVINAGPSGNIIYNANTVIDFSGGSGHVFEIVNTGDVIKKASYTLLGGTGDIFMHAEKVEPNSGNVRQSNFQFVAGGGSVFISADVDIYMNYASSAVDLIFDFSGVPAGGVAMVAGGDIHEYTDFIYTGGSGTGMGQVPNPDALTDPDAPDTLDNLHGEPVPGYGLYIATQNTEDTASVVTFHQSADITMNNQKGLIRTPYLHNVGNVVFDTYAGSGTKTDLQVVTDFWALQDDLTMDGSLTTVKSLSSNLNNRNMPLLELLGSNSAQVDQKPVNEQITLTYAHGGNIGVFNHILANDSTVSFTTANSTLSRQNANLRTDLMTVLGVSAFNGSNLSANPTTGHIELTTTSAMEAASTSTDAGLFATRIDLGVAGYKSSAGIDGVPGILASGIPAVVGVLGVGGTGASLYVGDSLYMDGGYLSFESIYSKVVFNNGYVLGEGGFSSSANPLTQDSYIDWKNVDLYGWMDLRDARTVMAAAMYPSVYTFPTQALSASEVANMGYQNIEWFSVDNSGLTSGQITLDDIPGFSSGSDSAYNPFPDSPFFNLEIGYLNDAHTSFGLIDFSRKMYTDTMPANLENQAPNGALASMARVIEGAPEFDVMDVAWPDAINYNAIENILYLSPTRDSYNRGLASISSGGNLDAVRMVDFNRMNDAFAMVGKRSYLYGAPGAGALAKNTANGVWMQGGYNRLNVDDQFDQGYGGFDVTTWSFTAGYDRQITDMVTVGAFFGYGEGDLDGWHREIDSDDVQLGVYTQFTLPQDFIISAGFAYGWQSYDLERNPSLGRDYQNHAPISYNERLSGDFDGNSTQVALELAKQFSFDSGAFLRPALGYSYQRVELDSYTENSHFQSSTANASLAQHVGDTTYEQHLIRLGTSGGWGNEMVEVTGRIFWVCNAGDDQATASASFAGLNSAAGTTSFAISGAEYDENMLQLGLGVKLAPVADTPFSIDLNYDALIGSDENNHALRLNLRYEF